jgi:HEPN domain-containing protein
MMDTQMNREVLQRIAFLRVQEASALLDAGFYAGAYYLIGYAVECALKACIAKQVKQYDFPDKKLANEAFTHDLKKLIRVAGLSRKFDDDRKVNENLNQNWAVVKDWNESARYEVSITESQAQDIYASITGSDGVLPWIKEQW